MSERGPDWQTLNAYVDGELEPVAAGRVAEAAGHDPAVASQIAVLYRLKGIAPSAVPSPSGDAMTWIGRPRRRAPLAALGALAAALVLSAGLWFVQAPRVASSLPPAAMQAARDLHEKWLTSGPPDTSAAKMLTALSDFGSMPSIPDLGGTGLTVGFVANAISGTHRILQVGYRGQHGCRLSMFVFHDIGFGHTPKEVAKGKILAYGWQASELGYLLFAEGMDRSRFDLIGREVEKTTRRGRPLDQRDQTRLAENKRESASCKA